MRLAAEISPFPRMLVFPFGFIGMVGFACSRLAPDLLLRLAHCPLREWTGLPCPTCGGTMTAVALAAGRWTEALQANPLVAIGLVIFFLWGAYSIAATLRPAWRRRIVFGSGEERTARILLILAVLVAWVWQWHRLST